MKRKYCYEFTEYRQYKCCECGRTMHEPTPHLCNGQYRKHKMKFERKEYEDWRYRKGLQTEQGTKRDKGNSWIKKIRGYNAIIPNFSVVPRQRKV